VDLILSLQNRDGGWATYENKRAGGWLEILNPSGVFGKIMVDYSWVECTSACVTALIEYQEEDPDYRSAEISRAIDRGVSFILNQQHTDGSWSGAWGICFTYGTWFALEALAKAGIACYNSESGPHSAIRKAAEFLTDIQFSNGSWGESYRSCVQDKYIASEQGQVINTSWALLGLMAIQFPDKEKVDRGIGFLLDIQEANGDWPQQGIAGVFNQNCMISYSAYRNIFPIWAMGRYAKSYSRIMQYRGLKKTING